MWSQPPPFHLTIEIPLNPHPEISRHSFARSAVAKPHQLPTYDMMGGKSWEEVLAPHQRGGWEVLGRLLLWCWDQGGQAEGKAFRAKEAGAFPAEKLGFFPTSPNIVVHLPK